MALTAAGMSDRHLSVLGAGAIAERVRFRLPISSGVWRPANYLLASGGPVTHIIRHDKIVPAKLTPAYEP